MWSLSTPFNEIFFLDKKNPINALNGDQLSLTYYGMPINKHFFRQNVSTTPYGNDSGEGGNFNGLSPATHRRS